MIASNILDDFLAYLKTTKGSSDTTIREYYYDIRTFLRFILVRKNYVKDVEFNEVDIDEIDIEILKSVDKQDIYAFNSFLENQKNNSNKTKYRKISAIRTFFNYLSTKIDVIDFNPLENIDMPKIEKTVPVYLTLEEAVDLLKTVQSSKSKFKYRDYAIITLFLNCGMRLSELSNLNIDDIKKDNTLVVKGKGNKERTIYLNQACLDALNLYYEHRPKVDDKALFLSMRNNRMGNRAIQKMVEKYVKLTGLDPDKYTVHKLRHTAATLMYQHGNADIRALQEVLGHESVTTTQIYTHINNKHLKATIENNPLSKINISEEI
ncbi:tyrosine recombinase XerC [Anaerosphaera multitolerans]|uniref:Tyrosine recombinase XerC n=1 Tax=Anaerosphaera multitolerans TaxID=2487351 RepID=A0A437S599_9FIRM|nr:tyrosine recombinase XerC [Anaerosphaera multitolerans]RVU54191.1 tyrosine recombinase XerC [Anaerosphaera multitolerans]